MFYENKRAQHILQTVFLLQVGFVAVIVSRLISDQTSNGLQRLNIDLSTEEKCKTNK